MSNTSTGATIPAAVAASPSDPLAHITGLYRNDPAKQWLFGLVFVASGIACWVLVVKLTDNAYQDAIAIAAVLGLQAFSLWQYYQWRQETMDTLLGLEDTEPDMKGILRKAIEEKPALEPLMPIWDKLHAGRLHHQVILVHITSLQYALASTLVLASLGGAVAAFFILPTGWNGAKPILTTLFISMIVMVTYCQMTPKVLSLPSNLTVHLARYHAFLALRWHTYRYIITGQGTDGVDQTPEAFLRELTQQLIELPPAPFGIDPSQVSSISALAQQFSLRTAQNADAAPATPGAGAPPANAIPPKPVNGQATNVASLPKYPDENRIARSSLTNGGELVALQGTISRAVEIQKSLPSWMELNEETGTISVKAKEAATLGEYQGEILLTMDSGRLAIAPVRIIIYEALSSANSESAAASSEGIPTGS